MTGDGKALQMGTSHELGQNFASAFDIDYPRPGAASGSSAWTTSWGSSTRMVGGLIMAHGDDAGLRVPPRLAPIQVAVIVDQGARRREAAGAAARTSSAPRGSGSSWTTGPTSRSAGARSTGSSRACRCGSRSARATWPTDRVTLVRRIGGGKTPTPLAGVLDAVRVALVEDQVALYDGGRAGAGTRGSWT